MSLPLSQELRFPLSTGACWSLPAGLSMSQGLYGAAGKESRGELEMSEGDLGKQKEQFSKASLIPMQSEELISSWKRQSLQKCLKFITHTESHYLQHLAAESQAFFIPPEESPSSSLLSPAPQGKRFQNAISSSHPQQRCSCCAASLGSH